jgi:hypothetical protein
MINRGVTELPRPSRHHFWFLRHQLAAAAVVFPDAHPGTFARK